MNSEGCGHFDAVIVGAGPAGAAAAIGLARAGWSVALVERQTFPRRKVCGECIAASNLPLLHALGIGTAFDGAAGPPLQRVALMAGDETVTAALPEASHDRHRWGRALGRETLDTLLRDRAREAGATVLQPCAVETLRGSPGRWTCTVRQGDDGQGVGGQRFPLHAPVLVDAHGSWQALDTAAATAAQPSRQATRHPPRQASDLFAFKANFTTSSLSPGGIAVLALHGGYGGMVVGDQGITTVACCLRRDRLAALRQACPGARAGDVVEAWLRAQVAGVRAALHGAVRDGAWLSAGPLAPGVRVGTADGIFRIGNAAGEAHPILGEGLSMALQSATLLCAQLLAEGGAVPGATAQAAAQRRYAAAWRRSFVPRLHLAAGFAHLAMRPGGTRLLMTLLRRWPGLLTQGARWGGKLHSVALPPPLPPPTPGGAVPRAR